MMRTSSRRTLLTVCAAAGAVAIACTFTGPAQATPGIRNAFVARYPTSTLLTRTQAATGSVCYACHQPPDTALQGNCYKEAIALRLAAGRTSAQAIADVERLDSDGDGVANVDEILAARADMPGQIGYNPGLVGPTGTDPCAANVNTPVTGQLETPPPPCRADFNDDGFLDFFDFTAFVDCFEGLGCPPGKTADFNGDGFPDFFDFADFVDAFDAGC